MLHIELDAFTYEKYTIFSTKTRTNLPIFEFFICAQRQDDTIFNVPHFVSCTYANTLLTRLSHAILHTTRERTSSIVHNDRMKLEIHAQ